MPQRLLLVAVLVGFVGLGLWSWRRLSQHGSDPQSRFVYRYGVRGFGLGSWPAFSVVFALIQAGDDFPSFLWALFTAAIVMLPLSLWSGYAWGRAMAVFFGPR